MTHKVDILPLRADSATVPKDKLCLPSQWNLKYCYSLYWIDRFAFKQKVQVHLHLTAKPLPAAWILFPSHMLAWTQSHFPVLERLWVYTVCSFVFCTPTGVSPYSKMSSFWQSRYDFSHTLSLSAMHVYSQTINQFNSKFLENTAWWCVPCREMLLCPLLHRSS